MKQICVFLADGFEEIEGLTVVDLLRRAGVETKMVSITGDLEIHGAHGIDIKADILFENLNYEGMDMLVLPGGMPGTLNLQKHEGLTTLLQSFHEQERYIAAICAAPSILGKMGLLAGRRACAYPTKEDALTGAEVLQEPVVVDRHIITSRGMGTAILFGLELISILCGEKKAIEIKNSIVF